MNGQCCRYDLGAKGMWNGMREHGTLVLYIALLLIRR